METILKNTPGKFMDIEKMFGKLILENFEQWNMAKILIRTNLCCILYDTICDLKIQFEL